MTPSTSDQSPYDEKIANLEKALRSELSERKTLEMLVSRLMEEYREPERRFRETDFPDPQPYGPDASEDFEGYQIWLEREAAEKRKRASILNQVSSNSNAPRISVLVPVYRPPLRLLQRCVESVTGQIYPYWELCICDDGSKAGSVERYLKSIQQSDRRIKVKINRENRGISAATNDALASAKGEFIFLLDNDDEIPLDALAEIALVATEDPTVDVVYTDEDKMDSDEIRFAPFFKPDWSPDHLLTHPYMTHGLAIRRSLVEDVGGFRSEFDGSQDYDLLLRVTERARTIHHIPKVLYHWRTVEGSTAANESAKPWAHEASHRALQDALDRRGEEAQAEIGNFRWAYRVRRRIKGSPLVTIVIPFRDEATLVGRCLASIEATAGHDNWEAVLVNNGSWEPETFALLKRMRNRPRVRVLDYSGEFNWSAINNWTAARTEGDHLLFLNNDIEGVSEGWLSAMLEHSQRTEVGAVGARLFYPDGRVQHAGVILGIGGISAHSFWFLPPDRNGYFGMDKVIRNYSAVTGACMMVRREVFEKMRGFDETLRVAFNDIDFCLRLRKDGYFVVYTPFATLTHHESASRGFAMDREERKIMVDRWMEQIRAGDPYYNPNLSLRRYDFGLAYPSEMPPWKDLKSMLGS